MNMLDGVHLRLGLTHFFLYIIVVMIVLPLMGQAVGM